MNWSTCLICQKEDHSELRCPLNKSSCNAREIYDTLKNLSEFRNLGKLPIQIVLPGNVISDDLFSNKAIGIMAHACHQKLTDSQLDRVKTRLKKTENQNETKIKKTVPPTS